MSKRVVLCLMLMFLGVSRLALAATYYISPSGNDSTGNGTTSNPWATVSKGCKSMASNDTLILKDGTYVGASNMFNYHTGSYPPNGSSGNYTTVKAENDGMVIIDGQMARIPFDGHDSQYLIVQGIEFKNSSETVFSIYANQTTWSSHIKIIKCGFSESNSVAGNPRYDLFNLRFVRYGLVEDCYGYGNGKYRFIFLDCEYCIFRRCIDRFDRGFGDASYGNLSSFRLYGSNYCLVQNCISIDANTTGVTYPDGSQATIYLVFFGANSSTGLDCGNNKIEGSMFINAPNHWLGFYGSDSSTYNNTWSNCIAAGLKRGIWNRSSRTGNNVDHMTFYNIVDSGSSYDNAVLVDGGSSLVNFNNSVLYGIGGYALNGATEDYNSFYNNSVGNVTNCSSGGHSITNVNPTTNSLKYLTRIESASSLSGKGSSGSDIGASILYQIGVSGTVYGESGYDTVGSVSLWPFPNEDIIRSKMKAYSYGSISGNRGFCADGTTLTKYIWEYLGNTIPPEIYGINSPSDLNTTVLSSNGVSLSWKDNSDNEDGFKLERKLSVTSGYSLIATLGVGVSSYVDSGLDAQTMYYYRVYAYNSSLNSLYSNEVYAQTLTNRVGTVNTGVSGGESGGGGGGGGCFIATACYGSGSSPEVVILSKFRDEYLARCGLGRFFIKVYYRLSPPIAAKIARNATAKSVVRNMLYPVVQMVKILLIFAKG